MLRRHCIPIEYPLGSCGGACGDFRSDLGREDQKHQPPVFAHGKPRWVFSFPRTTRLARVHQPDWVGSAPERRFDKFSLDSTSPSRSLNTAAALYHRAFLVILVSSPPTKGPSP